MFHSHILKKLTEIEFRSSQILRFFSYIQEQLDPEILLIHSAQFHPVSHSRKRLEVFSSPGRTQGPGAILTTANVVLWMLRHFQPVCFQTIVPKDQEIVLWGIGPARMEIQVSTSRETNKMVQPESFYHEAHTRQVPTIYSCIPSAFQTPFLNISR